VSTKLSLEPAPLWGVDWCRSLGQGRVGGTCSLSPDVNTEDGTGEGGRVKVAWVGEAELDGDADDVHEGRLDCWCLC